MSTPTKTKTRKGAKKASGIIWFEIPAENPERARKFYGGLFGWKIEQFPAMPDYWHINTGGADASPDGGMMTRKYRRQPIINYINVESVNKSAAKVVTLGGKICKGKTAVPHMGYFIVCEDSEGNSFALWEVNDRAK
jgi:predicted enzyme related to lactoylglutathione lyase